MVKKKVLAAGLVRYHNSWTLTEERERAIESELRA
jgi:hypothetical protein